MSARRISVAESFELTVEFEDEDQAAYLHMFLRRCGFEEFFQRTEPHLGNAKRTERAYSMVHASAKVEDALREAGIPSSIY